MYECIWAGWSWPFFRPINLLWMKRSLKIHVYWKILDFKTYIENFKVDIMGIIC